MTKTVSKLKEKLRSPKALVVVGLIGIILIALSSLFGGTEKTETAKKDQELTPEEYRIQLEEDICRLVTRITGNKNVTAVITLDSGIRYSYADIREESSSDETEKERQKNDLELKEGYITVKTADGGEQALLITTQMPEIRGVAIVCEGGDNPVINEKIQNAVISALNITSKRVYICGRQ